MTCRSPPLILRVDCLRPSCASVRRRGRTLHRCFTILSRRLVRVVSHCADMNSRLSSRRASKPASVRSVWLKIRWAVTAPMSHFVIVWRGAWLLCGPAPLMVCRFGIFGWANGMTNCTSCKAWVLQSKLSWFHHPILSLRLLPICKFMLNAVLRGRRARCGLMASTSTKRRVRQKCSVVCWLSDQKSRPLR